MANARVAWDRIIPETTLDPEQIGRFACGQPALDEWWLEKSLRYGRIGLCSTHVAMDGDRVVGFFTLSSLSVEGRALPSSRRAGKPTMQHPGYLLGMFAIRSDLQGSGVGAALLCHAIRRALDAADIAGGRFLVLDPVDERARGWYARAGFLQLKTGNRMFLPFRTAREYVGLMPSGFFVF